MDGFCFFLFVARNSCFCNFPRSADPSRCSVPFTRVWQVCHFRRLRMIRDYGEGLGVCSSYCNCWRVVPLHKTHTARRPRELIDEPFLRSLILWCCFKGALSTWRHTLTQWWFQGEAI
ncbi:hypothetical protein CEXT_95561 [Caerostris extrusa]|uniref:Secreted protein n=1 Tax=Caerostris extrusa TaxID=172846 RepID=A0AAV4VHG0_CAEEX|nr:hypothetical protein CEXT_95561 [Caerostris extrusa]